MIPYFFDLTLPLRNYTTFADIRQQGVPFPCLQFDSIHVKFNICQLKSALNFSPKTTI